MKKAILYLIISIVAIHCALATGEPATQFNIFVPPNNDNTRRDVCLIVTAIYDSTSFNIVDDAMDGDSDDSKTGWLMAGQSYVLYIRNNGVNDDAPAAGTGIQKQDGDYFNITSNKLIFASQSTDSDWQHDWVPSVNGTGIGNRFIIYAPKISSSQRDVNVMAYSDSTTITIRKISVAASTSTGFTNVDINSSQIVVQKLLNRGQDLIYANTSGRNLLISGHTYVIESNKPVTVQYGALWGNERDGGGYVPSSNGSGSGDLFYFTVPYQVTTEQEIRIASWSNNNNIVLDRYLNGSWVNVKNYTGVQARVAAEWIGKTSGQTYPTVFRVTCSAGKKVSVFEANWLETGSVGTSDIATMASASNGKASGKEFLVYMSPPGYEQNVTNPFTSTKFTQNTHAYLYANTLENSTVTVKDAYTNGTKFSKTYNIVAGRYVDCALNLNEWKSIYNGTGTASGPERPYLIIESSEEISVMVTNFNDNWMMYFGSSQVKVINQTGFTIGNKKIIPGDTATLVNSIAFDDTVSNVKVQVMVASGLIPVSCTLTNIVTNQTYTGVIATKDNGAIISFPTITSILPANEYVVSTKVVGSQLYNNGKILPPNTVLNVETVVTGTIDGQLQQSVYSEGLSTMSDNTSRFLYSRVTLGQIVTDLTSSWSSNWVDYDGDGDDDLFLCELDKAKQNILYVNNGNSTFTRSNSGIFASSTDRAASIASSWADIDNDGDLDFIVANNGKPGNFLYKNNGSGSFTKITDDPTVNTPGYYHSVSFADYDNDGYVDLYMSDYMPTKFNRLFHNKGDGTFEEISNTAINLEAAYSLIGAWADFDNDGDQDIFVANDKDAKNSLYRNDGKGIFTKMSSSIVCNEVGSSVSANWIDYDNDKDLDLFVVNSSSSPFLYKNNGNGDFTKVTNTLTSTGNASLHGAVWLDVDNDGDLDVYIAANNKSKLLYINDGSGNFVKKQTEIINNSLGSTYSGSTSDFDKDGDVDLFVSSLNNEANFLYTHNASSNKYLEIKLKGTISNGAAIGAKILVKANINGAPVWQTKEINSQSGFGGQNSFTQHFGLMQATVVDSLIIKWPSGIIQQFAQVNTNQILSYTEPNGCNATSVAFHDLNGNCIKDGGEEVLANMRISIQPGNITVTSDHNGVFKSYLSVGTYSTTALSTPYWTSSCNIQQLTVTNQLIGTQVDMGNIGYSSIGNASDLFVTSSPTALRRGFKNKITLYYGNKGNTAVADDAIYLTVPNGVYLISASTPWTSKTGNEYMWSITDMKAGKYSTIQIVDSVSLSSNLGASLTFASRINIPTSDGDITNNNHTVSMQVVGSLDPNDMIVSPKGEGTVGYIVKQQVLTYTINFENIGNYPAQFVILSNELPKGIDVSTIEIISSSHPYHMAVYGETLKVEMEDIELPGKLQDSLNCQGFVQYSAKIIQGMADGAEIENKAAIIFDYNEAINTNQTLNTIKLFVDDENVSIVPNPASSFINIALRSASPEFVRTAMISEIDVETVFGTTVMHQQIGNANTATIDIDALAPGMYYLRVTDSSDKTYTKKFIVK